MICCFSDDGWRESARLVNQKAANLLFLLRNIWKDYVFVIWAPMKTLSEPFLSEYYTN